jgi:YkoY family integral membrane protein
VVPQTFGQGDFFLLSMLVLLEGLLSADNALVLALLVRHLPPKEQQRALTQGLAMAFGFRAIGILAAGFIMKLWWLCGIGALYLVFLAAKHFVLRGKGHAHGMEESASADATASGPSYRRTLMSVAFTDAVFAVDSILVAVALVNTSSNPDKLWLVYLGGFLGILLLRVAASIFIRLIMRYPSLDGVAYALVGWVGVKLGFTSLHLFSPAYPELPKAIFWGGFALILLTGVFIEWRRHRNRVPALLTKA